MVWPLAAEEVDFTKRQARQLAVPTRRLTGKTSLILDALHAGGVRLSHPVVSAGLDDPDESVR